MNRLNSRILKKRRSSVVLFVLLILIGYSLTSNINSTEQVNSNYVLSDIVGVEKAIDVLERVEVKGRSPKTDYARDQFSDGWAVVGGCDMRNIMLNRSMTDVKIADDGCIVLSGTLQDPYTGNEIKFVRGSKTSGDVQIDHVVALSDSWQKGAQALSSEQRLQLANDPLNLLAVDGPANQKKGDSDAASWLPPNKSFRCQYVARQIAVKDKYILWVTEAEKSAMIRVLNGCGEQVVPVSS
jgi:hypothetical protein